MSENVIIEKLGELDQHYRAGIDDLTSRIDDLEASRNVPPRAASRNDGNPLVKAESFLRTGDTAELREKGWQISDSATGGAIVAPELRTLFFPATGTPTSIIDDVRREGISSNQLEMVFNTTRAAVSRYSEGGSRVETSGPGLQKVTFSLYELSAYPVVTNETLDSTEFNVSEFIHRSVRESSLETMAAEVIDGTGSTQFKGIVANATDSAGDEDSPARAWGTVQTVAATGEGSPGSDFSYTDLVELVYTLAPRYRGNAKFYMSTSALRHARSLLDLHDRPIWLDAAGGVAGRPASIMGYPVVEVPQMAAMAEGSKSVMFGDLGAAFVIVDNSNSYRIIRDSISVKGSTGFYISAFVGGGVADSNAVKVLVTA